MAIPTIGAGTAIGFQKEVTYNTNPAGTPIWNKAVRWTPVPKRTREIVPHLVHGDSGEAQDTFVSSQGVTGDLEVVARYLGNGYLWEACMGQAVTAGAGPYTHTYTPLAGGLLPSLTLDSVRGNSTKGDNFTGCKVASWELSQQQGRLAMLRASIIGKGITNPRGAALTPTFGAGEFLHPSHGPVLIYNAVSYTCQSISITGDNKLARVDEMALDTAEPAQTAPREYRIRATLATRTITLLPAFLADTSASITWALTGATSPNAIAITGREAQIMAYDDPITSYGVVTQTVEWLLRASGATEALDIVFTNSSSTHFAQ